METDTEQIYTGNGSVQTIEITVLMTPFEFLERNKLISEETKAFVTERTLQNLYNAEAKRMSLPEKMGFDGETKGRGQIGEPAYNDVMAKFKNEYNKYAKNNQINKSNIFAKDIKNEKLEDFLVTFYLAVMHSKTAERRKMFVGCGKIWNSLLSWSFKYNIKISRKCY